MSDTLLPPNSTPLERDTARLFQRLTDLPTPLAPLWRPDDCPAELLPWLAWSLSIDTWKPYWSEAVKRQRIRDAIPIHRRRGTAAAVRQVVEAFGAGVAMREWWQQTPPGTPHTFEIVLTVGQAGEHTEAFQQDIVQEVDRVKPVRSHYHLTLGIEVAGGLGLAGTARGAHYRRLRITEPPFTGGLGLAGMARPLAYARLSTEET